MRMQDRAHQAFCPIWVLDNTMSSATESQGLSEADSCNLPPEIDQIQGGREFMNEFLWFLQVNRRKWDAVDMNQVEDGYGTGIVRSHLRKAGWLEYGKVGESGFWYFTKQARQAMAPRPVVTPEVSAAT